MRHLLRLFVNHIDAWGLTFIISCLALALHNALDLKGLSLAAVLSLCYWLGFAVNDYYDAPFDAQDAKKAQRNFFAQANPPRKILVLVFSLISLALIAFFLQFGFNGFIVCLIGMFALWSYSAPPLRLKTRPGFDLLMHMAFVQTFPYGVTLWLLNLEWSMLDRLLMLGFVLSSLAAQLEQQARDYEVDSRTERNFTTQFGLPFTTRLFKLVTALMIALGAVFFWRGFVPLELLPFALICLPLFAHRLLRGIREPRSEWLVRFTLIAALVYAGVAWGRVLWMG
jgi:lycopene elongase/hydratase (dihydrobisanhydrobacterioruberin-forming)